MYMPLVAAAAARGLVEDHVVECTNGECNWRGLYSACYSLGEVQPLCPACKENTEPTQF